MKQAVSPNPKVFNKKVFRKISQNSQVNTRSSYPEVFCQKDVLKNFAKLVEKHLYQSVFFSKVTGWKPEALLKKRLQHKSFPVNL